MNSLSPQDITVAGVSPVVGIVTNSPISNEAGLTNGGVLNMRVDIVLTGVTQVGTITAKLQHKSPNGSYADLAGANASATVTADGTVSLRQNIEVAADQPNMPIKSMIRVVLTTTSASDRVTISKVWLQQPR